ncbi:MAG: hypothetical protein WD072_09775 [Pirellulales bacterium]
MHSFALPLAKPIRSCSGLFTGFLGSLALALAGAGPVAANPLGVERQGGAAIAAIKSLTAEQARELVAKRTDATARIGTGKAALAFASGGVTLRGALMLSGLESLDAETAAVLADYDEGPLFLDGLTTLSPEAARALKAFKGGPRSYASFGRCLSLAGLETLSPEAAAELAAFPGEALFLGVQELSEAAFRRLMTFRRRLYLPRLGRIPVGAAESMADYRGPALSILGLATLSPDDARVLAGLGNRWNGRLPNVKNLSPETAAVLAGFKGVRLELDGATLSAEAVKELARFPGVLLLRGLTTLSDNMLAALAGFNGGGLGLDGVTALSTDLAKQLATFATKFLYLDDVTELSPEAAAALAGFPGTVSLDGLTELSPEVIRALGDLNKRSLKGVTSLSPEAAAAVVEGFQGNDLTLNLTSLPADTARELAKFNKNSLFLDQLTELSDEAAAALGSCALTNLWLRGLTDLSPGAAIGLAALKAAGNLGPTLRLDSLRSLSPEAAEALAASVITYLELIGLETLSAGTAKALARSNAFNGSLPSLTTLSADAAAALGTFAGNKSGGDKLNLFGLTSLDAASARGLAAFRGNLELDGLTEIDPDTAAALATYTGPKLSLRGLKSLSAETAEQLAKVKAWDGGLSSLRSLSDEAAAALAGFEGKGLLISGVPLSDRAVQALAGFRGSSLYLIVPQLSDESVRALAAFKGDSLSLAGLVEPPAELARLLPEFACKKLSLHPWEYYLGSRQPVTTADARLVAAYAGRLGKTCVLPGITGFETPDAVEIANTLAASTGSLSIPNLKRVSPKSLTALIEKGNIELPPIEFIELIQEPDGGPTDDFVIPDNFPERGRR